MSKFNAYLVDSIDIYDYLSQPGSRGSCIVIGDDSLPNIVTQQPLSESLAARSVCVGENLAWPVGLKKIVITGTTISKELLIACCNFSSIALLAVMPIKQSVNCQSVELLLNREIELRQLNQLIEKYQADANIVTKLPDLNIPGLVVLDMDSTSIEIECIDEIAKLAGVGDEVSKITELAMQGKLDFAQSLRARVAKLKGVKLPLLDIIAKDLPLMPGMIELVEQFHAKGWKVAIASGGFTYFADNLKQQLGLDDAISNQLEVSGGELTGQVVGCIVDAQVKAETVVSLAQKYQIPLSQTIAIGDGANDLKMMEQAALGIAFHAKPLVQAQASVEINRGDLSAVIGLLSR